MVKNQTETKSYGKRIRIKQSPIEKVQSLDVSFVATSLYEVVIKKSETK